MDITEETALRIARALETIARQMELSRDDKESGVDPYSPLVAALDRIASAIPGATVSPWVYPIPDGTTTIYYPMNSSTVPVSDNSEE